MRDYDMLIMLKTRSSNSSEAMKKADNICEYINKHSSKNTNAKFVSIECHGKGSSED